MDDTIEGATVGSKGEFWDTVRGFWNSVKGILGYCGSPLMSIVSPVHRDSRGWPVAGAENAGTSLTSGEWLPF